MGRFIQLVIGPAGVGKSTYCKTMQEHGKATHRTIHVANLDPAAESFEYEAAFDVRELISLDNVMEELGFGPNGGLVYCMEYFLANSDWLKDELDNFGEDEYVILDCPGQVELYCHLPIMHNLAKTLGGWGFRVISVFLLDALTVIEPSKFISGCLLSLSCMLQLQLPHINVVTKCDIADKEQIDAILDSDGAYSLSNAAGGGLGMPGLSEGLMGGGGLAAATALARGGTFGTKLNKMTSAIGSVVDDFMIVSFITLDPTDEDSIQDVLLRTDHAIQYGEDVEPKEPKDEDYDNDNDN